MATLKSQKKKKSAPAKKRVPKPKTPKIRRKITKVPKKKMLKKPIKSLAKPKEPIKAPPAKGDKAATRKLLSDMREKQIAEISENLVPESLTASSDIGDLVDQAGDERDRELSLLLTGRDKEKLAAINEALEKLKEGTYGVCEECGDKIGQGRLKVMPLAKYCVTCQSNLEREMTLQRKAEEDLKYRGLAFASNTEEEES
ncbi:MAG: TraR/DksA family transcriptional regulator [Thermodesulfobacteriota bacterium]|jgi:DnaK suppressor protein